MIIIRCTQKLLKELKHFEVSDNANEVDDSIFGAWYANLLIIDRRKCILMTNEKSLFTFLIPSVRKKDFIDLKELFFVDLSQTLRDVLSGKMRHPAHLQLLPEKYSIFHWPDNRIQNLRVYLFALDDRK